MNKEQVIATITSAVAVASLTFAGTQAFIVATTPAPSPDRTEIIEALEVASAAVVERDAALLKAEQADTNAKWSACIYWLGGWSQGNGYTYTAAERAHSCAKDGSFRNWNVLEYGTGDYE